MSAKAEKAPRGLRRMVLFVTALAVTLTVAVAVDMTVGGQVFSNVIGGAPDPSSGRDYFDNGVRLGKWHIVGGQVKSEPAGVPSSLREISAPLLSNSMNGTKQANPSRL